MQHNRWFVVLGALMIQVSLGAIYIYSVFKPALKEHFPAWSATDIALPAQVLLAMGAITMIIAGKIQDKIGPKKTAIAGAAILLAGMYIAAKAQTLAQFVFGFGVLGGIGIYAAYVCPIATCVKWFPDKRGLITGFAVAGFGAGGLVFAPLANYFIAHIGIMAALFYLGLIYFW
jgi:Major Facilitator Superfamily.